MREKKDPCALVLGITMESSMGFPQKLKLEIELPYNPESLLLYFSQKKSTKTTQNTNSKRHMGPYVHCSVIYSIQDMEAT